MQGLRIGGTAEKLVPVSWPCQPTHLASVLASMVRFSISRSVAASPSSIFFHAVSAGSAGGGVSVTQLGMTRDISLVTCFAWEHEKCRWITSAETLVAWFAWESNR